MAQSFSKIYLHLVFSTKDRRKIIPKDRKEDLHAYLAGILNNLNSHALEINSMPDHVHILFNLSKTLSASKLVEQLKSSSSHWIKEQGILWDGWQNAYGIFSVSESQLEVVQNYIQNQEAHHQTLSYEDELRKLLRKHRVEFDEVNLWR